MSHILLEKADQNRIIADLAAEKEYFSNAVSRGYYRLFLEVTHYLTECIEYPLDPRDLRSPDEHEIDRRFKGSHGKVFKELQINVDSLTGENSDESITVVARLVEMRAIRNRAEYHSTKTLPSEWDDTQRKSEQVRNILVRLVDKYSERC